MFNRDKKKLHPLPRQKGKIGVLVIDDSPILEKGKRIAEFNVVNGMATIKITVRNEDDIKPKKMIKPSAKVEKGHWFLNKYVKSKVEQLQVLTRTQKRRTSG